MEYLLEAKSPQNDTNKSGRKKNKKQQKTNPLQGTSEKSGPAASATSQAQRASPGPDPGPPWAPGPILCRDVPCRSKPHKNTCHKHLCNTEILAEKSVPVHAGPGDPFSHPRGPWGPLGGLIGAL